MTDKMAEPRALDIGERQVLVLFAGDRVPWHHRLLMERISGSRWLVVTPTLELEISNLDQVDDLVPLERGAVMPSRCRPLFADPLSGEELAALRWQCKRYADVLGAVADAPATDSDAGWVLSDPSHPQFSESVPPALLSGGHALLRGAVGLVEEDPDSERFTAIERVAAPDLDAWLSEKRSGAGRDPRLNSGRHGEGERLRVADALRTMKMTDKKAGWVFRGPQAIRELLEGIVSTGLEPPAYAAHCLGTGGVSPHSGIAQEFRHLIAMSWITILPRQARPLESRLERVRGEEAADDTAGDKTKSEVTRLRGPRLVCDPPDGLTGSAGHYGVREACIRGAARRGPDLETAAAREGRGGVPDEASGEGRQGRPRRQGGRSRRCRELRGCNWWPPCWAKGVVACAWAFGLLARCVNAMPSSQLLPLPVGGRLLAGHPFAADDAGLRAGRGADGLAGGHVARLANDACASLNAFATARDGRPLRIHGRRPHSAAPSAAQLAVRARLGRCVQDLGRPPDQSESSSLADLLKSNDLYCLNRESTRRPYDAARVRVVRDGICPRDLEAMVPEHVRRQLADPWRYIVKDDAELSLLYDDDYVTPYTDQALRSHEAILDLSLRLKEIGFVGFRRQRRCRIGVFTVARKDAMLRLVFDCRPANQLHRVAPAAALATPAAFASLDFSDSRLGVTPADRPSLVGGAIDLVDSFYQLQYSRLSEFFSLDAEFLAGECHVSMVRDGDTGDLVPVGPDDIVYACLMVLPMGWAWSLWCCQELLCSIMTAAGRRLGAATEAEAGRMLLRVGRRCRWSHRTGASSAPTSTKRTSSRGDTGSCLRPWPP